MTVTAAEQATHDTARVVGTAAPCLIAGRLGGRIISVLFVASIVLFVLAVVALGPISF